MHTAPVKALYKQRIVSVAPTRGGVLGFTHAHYLRIAPRVLHFSAVCGTHGTIIVIISCRHSCFYSVYLAPYILSLFL